MKRCAQLCTRNVLAQVWVLSPEFPLSKVADEAESQEYLDAVEKVEPEVEDLARRIVDNLNIDISSPDDNVDVIDLCAPASIIEHQTSF